MSRQDAIDPAYRLVAHRPQGALPGSFARRLVLAPLLIGGERWLMRDEPPRVVLEPIPEGAPPHVGELREFPDTRPAFEAPDVEPGQCNELLAIGVRVDLADGCQHSRGCGLAQARQLDKQWAVLTHLQSLDSLGEPQVLFGQSIREPGLGSQTRRSGMGL